MYQVPLHPTNGACCSQCSDKINVLTYFSPAGGFLLVSLAVLHGLAEVRTAPLSEPPFRPPFPRSRNIWGSGCRTVGACAAGLLGTLYTKPRHQKFVRTPPTPFPCPQQSGTGELGKRVCCFFGLYLLRLPRGDIAGSACAKVWGSRHGSCP